jgi:hypothetical protein
MVSFLLPTPNAAHFHSLRVFHQVKQWIGEADNMEAVEEAYRILTDEKQNGHLVLLDAKAAFDKVIPSHLFRRMYHAGIQDKTWTIIKSLHHNAESCIKWQVEQHSWGTILS